jgi:hypothetical protein
MNRRNLGVGIAAVLVVVILVVIARVSAAGTGDTGLPSPTKAFFSGYYTSADLMDVTDSSVDSGDWQVSYAIDVRFTEKADNATLVCGLRDPNHRILHFSPDSRTRLKANSGVQHLEFTGVYELPEIAIGIRCYPTVPGIVTAEFSNIALTTRRG